MKPIGPVTRMMHRNPLAAAVALLLGLGIASTVPDARAAAVGAEARAERYSMRLQQRMSRAMRVPAPLSAAARVPHPAATLPVTSCLDDDDPGTLRNVVAVAAEGDVVDLSALTCSTITLTQGPIDTSVLGEHHLYDLTVQGPGRGALTIDADNASQALVIGGFSSDKGTFTANDLTIANGRYDSNLAACIEGFGGALVLNRVDVTNCHASGTYSIVFGGAVDVTTLSMTDSTITNSSATGTGSSSTAVGAGAYASDSMTLVDSTISGNTLSAPFANNDGYATVGGGLYSRGDLAMTNTTLSGNTIEATNDGENARGGGVYVRGIATITGSTIDGNSADGEGGGIYKAIYSVYGEPGAPNPPTVLDVVDSTLSGNSAARGGGIATSRPLTLSNSTVALNTAADGGAGVQFVLAGIEDSGGTLAVDSSIIATNTAGDGATFAADLDADDTLVISGANNLVIVAGSALTLPADTLLSDPMLLPLALNGGATRTHALLANSPAIDAGNNAAALEFDQRGEGFARVSGTAADIGAFELQQADSDVIFVDGFDGTAPPLPVD